MGDFQKPDGNQLCRKAITGFAEGKTKSTKRCIIYSLTGIEKELAIEKVRGVLSEPTSGHIYQISPNVPYIFPGPCKAKIVDDDYTRGTTSCKNNAVKKCLI
jgi:hypothetical protein